MKSLQFGPELNVDFGVEGRQVGLLSIPNELTGKPLTKHQVPVVVIHQGDGPVVCLVAGAEIGDATGTSVLQTLARTIDTSSITGTLIICPALRAPLAQPYRSTNEPDDLLAHFSASVLSVADVIIEVTSESARLSSTPHASVWPSDDEESNQIAEAIMIAFGAPDSVRRFDPPRQNTLAHAAQQLRTPFVQVIIGEYNKTNRHTRMLGISGCHNALQQTGVMAQTQFDLRSTRMLEIAKTHNRVSTPTAGLIHWHADLGGAVYLGNPLAEIFDPYRPLHDPVVINAPMNGVLLTKHSEAFIDPSYYLALIGDEVPR